MTDEPGPRSLRLTVDTRRSPINALHKTLYALSSVADAEFQFVEADLVEVMLYPKAGDALKLESYFRQLLSDFTIQAQVNAETATI